MDKLFGVAMALGALALVGRGMGMRTVAMGAAAGLALVAIVLTLEWLGLLAG